MLAVTDIGMVSPVGLSVAASCAAARAGIRGIVTLDDVLVFDEEAEEEVPVQVHRVPRLSAGLFGYARLLQLACGAVDDLRRTRAGAGGGEDDAKRLGVILVLPDYAERFAWLELLRADPATAEGDIDPDIYNAAGQFVALKPGASFFDSVTSFEMARGGRIDTVILGAYEVDQTASVANWSTADAKRGGIGGAMDLLSGKGDLIIVMEHTDSKGRPKLRKKCTYPLTGKGCVTYVVTDLALLRWDGSRFVLEEVAPGFTAQEVIAMTEMEVTAGANVRAMQ